VAGWENFFVAEAGAAAALAGLLFVSVSINLARILQIPALPWRAAEALLALLSVLIVALLALVPGQSAQALGLEICVTGVVLWVAGSLALVRSDRSQPRFLLRLLTNQLPPVAFVVAGLLIALGHPAGMYWMVPGTFLAFAAGVLDAWVLLIEILR
jgi:modulator of FtsH protease